MDIRMRLWRPWTTRVLATWCIASTLILLLAAAGSAAENQVAPLPGSPDLSSPPVQAALLAASSATGPTSPILDHFNRMNEDPLSQGGQWLPYDPRGPGFTDLLEVSSNQAAALDNNRQNISFRPLIYSGDFELYATVAAKPGVGESLTLVFNIREIGGFTWDGFYLGWKEAAGTDVLTLSRVIDNEGGGTYGTASVEMSVGDKLLARRIGTQIEGWIYQSGIWSLMIVATDDSLLGGMIGLGIANTGGRWDDYGGGPFGPPPITQSTGVCEGEGTHARSGSACLSDPVNTLTGAFTTSVDDLRLPGIGVPFGWSRSYTSLDATVGRLGPGWTDSYATSLAVQPNGDVILHGDEGQQVFYTKQLDGSFVAARGALSVLSSVAGGYKLVRRDQVVYLFDAQGRLTSMKDRNNQGLTFIYSAGQLQTITDSVGRAIALQYQAGLLHRVTLPDGRYVEYGHLNGRLSSVRDARGSMTQYGYGAGGRLETIGNQRGKTIVRNVYDTVSGRVVEQFDALNNRSQFAWDPGTQTATMTDARLHQWKDVYASNLLAQRIDPLENTTRFEYDNELNVRTIIDARSNATTMIWDASGNLLTRTAPPPLSYLQEWTYNARNDPLTYKDGRGNVTNHEYDPAGNLTLVRRPDADGPGPLGRPVWLLGRDPAGTGLLSSITDPRGKKTDFMYEGGNLKEIKTQLGNRTTLCYDGSGRTIGLVDPRGTQSCALPNDYRWTYTYNEHDQLRAQADPLGNVTDLGYDPAGNLSSRTDAKLHVTSWGYDDANRLKTVTAPDPDGAGQLAAPVTEYGYDEVGNLKTRKDANLNQTLYEYDDANRLAKTTAPMTRVWTYGYDPNGNVREVVDANGNSTLASGDGTSIYGYDELNRLRSIDYSDATPDVSFGYDANDNRTQMTDGSGQETYGYDPINRLTSLTRGASTISFAYDLLNLTQRTYPLSPAISYSYDDDERLQSVVAGGQTTSYLYDAAANVTRTNLPAGNNWFELRGYDRAGRLTSVKVRESFPRPRCSPTLRRRSTRSETLSRSCAPGPSARRRRTLTTTWIG